MLPRCYALVADFESPLREIFGSGSGRESICMWSATRAQLYSSAGRRAGESPKLDLR
jgi:hypothetical protein